MTPESIEQLFSSGPSSTDNDEDEVVLSDEEKSQRIQRLTELLHAAKQLWDSGSSELDLVAQKVGDGSRDESWRIPLGESQLLDFFLSVVTSDGLRPNLTLHTLRVIGNTCADTDENRQRVVAAGCLPRIVQLLNDDSLAPIVVTVLFNICVDYEPAQVAVYKAGLNPELVSMISNPSRLQIANSVMGIISKLLGLVANQEPEANYVHPATPFVLLEWANSQESADDLETFLGQASAALTYLAHEQFQTSFLSTPQAVSTLLQAFSRACDGFDAAEADSEDLTQLKKVQSVFIQALSDLAAHPSFASLYPLDSPEIQTVQGWISSRNIHLQSAACLALGNIARSDELCITLVQRLHIHERLVSVLSDPSVSDSQLLHASLSFLKNLAIPASNKPIFGAAGLFDGPLLPRIWDIGVQTQVQFDAVSLARLLLVNCPENVQRVTRGPGQEDASNETATESRTGLQHLLDVFSKTDQEPTKMEAARAALAACRVVHSDPTALSGVTTPETTDQDSGLQAFYDTHDNLPAALTFLASQKKFPVLRSELWFVLALMARSPEGSGVIARLTERDHDLLGALVEAVTGKGLESQELEEEGTAGAAASAEDDGSAAAEEASLESQLSQGLQLEPQQVDPSKAASIAKVDRENCLVLIHELMKQVPDTLNPTALRVFRKISAEGGELVLADREQQKGE